MSHSIPAVYERGAFHPLTPLGLREHQRVRIHIIAENPQDTIDNVMEWLMQTGKISLPGQTDPGQCEAIAPCSDAERIALAKALGKTHAEPLSTVILDDRGAW